MDSQRRFDWWLAGLCLARTSGALVFINYAAALPLLRVEWGMSAAAAGSISTGFNIGYAVSLVVLSSLADYFGPKRIYLVSITAATCFSLAFALFARDYHSGLILYSLVGISMGGTYTTGLMILAHRYPPLKRGMASGFFIAATSMGYALSLVISGLTLPVGGYRLSFLITGLGTLASLGLSAAVLRGVSTPKPATRQRGGFSGEVLRNKPAMLLIAGYTFHNFELLGMWAWTPAFLAAVLAVDGLEGLQAAGMGSYLNAFFHFMGLVASFSMGMLSDRLGRARVLFWLALASAVTSLFYGFTFGASLYLVVGLGMFFAFTGLGDSPVLSAGLTEATSPAYLGAAFGLRSLLGFGAGAIAPLVFGAVLDATQGGSAAVGWGLAYLSLGLSGLGAAGSALAYGRIRRRA